MRAAVLRALACAVVLAAAAPCGAAEPFLVVGHRGAPAVECENTLEGFAKALELGANALELDVCMTRDRRLVVWHDWRHSSLVSVVREVGGEPGLRCRPWVPDLGSRYRTTTLELDLAEFREHYGYTLRILPVGTPFRTHHRIPTLDEFLAWAGAQGKLERFFLDVKLPADRADVVADFVRVTRDLLVKAGLDQRAVLLSTEPAVVTAFLKARGAARYEASFDQEIVSLLPESRDYRAFDRGAELGCAWASIGRPRVGLRPWSTYLECVTRDQASIAAARRRRADAQEASVSAPVRLLDRAVGWCDLVRTPGPRAGREAWRTCPVRLLAWTINDEAELRALIGAGVDAIVTDHPETLAKVLAERR